MKFDLTVTITAILGIAAIISPIATAIINNRYQLKLKRIELDQELRKETFFYRRGVFEDYLRFTGQLITYHSSEEHKSKYGAIYPLALIYFPDRLATDVMLLNDSITKQNWTLALNQLNALAPKIRTLLQTM